MRRSPVRSVARNGVDMVSLAPDRRTLVDSHRLQLHGERVIVHPPLHSAQPAAGQHLRGGGSHQLWASHQSVHILFIANDTCLRDYDLVVAHCC